MDIDPVPAAILLVKDGSRGDGLLFKYPYCFHYNEYLPLSSDREDNGKLLNLNDDKQAAANVTDKFLKPGSLLDHGLMESRNTGMSSMDKRPSQLNDVSDKLDCYVDDLPYHLQSK